TGDIYSLFYELGIKLLKPKGYLAFITSNKWMRAAYGESLRKYFVEKSNPVILIDFGGVQVFDTATVDTNILISEKAKYEGETKACILDKNFSINNTSDYFNTLFIKASYTSANWTVLGAVEQTIKNKIEKIGIPLKNWDVQINYGIKTGYNEAFIIDENKRNDEIIRPILLGKNIKRFTYEWSGNWLINAHNGIKSKGIPRIDVEKDYPVVYEYLLKHRTELEKRLDQGDHWSNLRNCAYLEDFNKVKIGWGNLALKSQFSFIPADYILNAPSPFFVTENYYLLAVLNSTIADYYIKQLGVSRNGGYFEYKPMFVEQLPIPFIDEAEQKKFCDIVEKIIYEKTNNRETSELENSLDKMVFDLYNLVEEEINLVSNY
ncbi:hypothetical protein EZL74_13045, partial [Flavobacterium silvisoli]